MRRFSEGARIDVAQIPYNLLRRSAEAEVLPFCQENDIAVMGYQPYAGGLLTGTVTRDAAFGGGDWRARAREYSGVQLSREMDVIEHLKTVAARRGCTLAQLALTWVLASPEQIVPVTGAERPELIESTIAGLEFEMTQEDRAMLADLASRVEQIEKGGPPARDAPKA
jgi:aryl-alcohol dehydrogenase-like predicted oxidoreductase